MTDEETPAGYTGLWRTPEGYHPLDVVREPYTRQEADLRMDIYSTMWREMIAEIGCPFPDKD